MMQDRKAFNRYFRRFLWSSILIALSGCLGNVVDASIVGNLIGEDGVSAINLTKPMVQFMFTISMLLATGAGMLVGMELGKKNYGRASSFFTLSIGGCVAFGVLMTACGFLFPHTITGWLCSKSFLFDYTYEYLRVMLIGAPFYMLAWGLATMVGVDGSPRLASVAILVDNALNLFLDVVFIHWCGWGIAGSAWATVLGHVAGVAIMCRHFAYAENHLQVVRKREAGTGALQLTGQIISQGAPLAVASVCLTALLYCSNSIVLGAGGREYIYAFAVCLNLLQIYNLFVAGTCRTIQSLGSIEVGKGDSEAFRLIIRKSFRFITIAMAVTCVGIWCFPEAVARFFGASEPAMLRESVHALRIFALSFIPFCYIYTVMIVYKLYGYHKMALFISVALSLTVIPVMWLVARYAPEWLWYSFLMAYALEGIAIVIIHKAGHLRFALAAALVVLLCMPAQAEVRTEFGDSTKTHVFTLGGNLMTRGEYITGAVPNKNETYAAFVLARTRLSLNYKQPHLEVQITPQHIGVWGTTGGGSLSLREAWAKADVKGFFTQLGRQTLVYDDGRVMGLNDWSMTSYYHDALRIGYEGHGHKIHLTGAYCQNNSNMWGGTVYLGGVQPYKNMEALWYHYDFKRWFSASLLFVNTGMESQLTDAQSNPEKKTYYQQMAGTYWRFRYEPSAVSGELPAAWWVDVDGSFYYQFGRTENNLPLNAWMLAVEAKAQANRWVRFNAGYFYLSGDENYTVPPPHGVGMQQQKHDHSFNLLYGSRHQFYGAMDFFYLQSYYGGYSPGMQDVHAGATFLYRKQFDFTAEYHAMATTVDVSTAPNRLLGHELELKARYSPAPWVTISANYTFMQGTKTMEIVKRASDRNQSHWVYLMVVFNPTFVKVRF